MNNFYSLDKDKNFIEVEEMIIRYYIYRNLLIELLVNDSISWRNRKEDKHPTTQNQRVIYVEANLNFEGIWVENIDVPGSDWMDRRRLTDQSFQHRANGKINNTCLLSTQQHKLICSPSSYLN